MKTDYPSLLDEARKRFKEHMPWMPLKHTPWENDAPIIAAELAKDAVASAPTFASAGVNCVGACLERVKQLEAELDQALAKFAEVTGAMDAQDGRERDAGERCGVSALESGCDWPDRIADVVIGLRDKLAEVEKEQDESRAAQRSIIAELQQAMADVFRHLSPPTDRHAPWTEQVMDAIDAINDERDTALSRLAQSDALLREAAHEMRAHEDSLHCEIGVTRPDLLDRIRAHLATATTKEGK